MNDDDVPFKSIADTSRLSMEEAWFAWWEHMKALVRSDARGMKIPPGFLDSLHHLMRMGFFAGEGHMLATTLEARATSEEAVEQHIKRSTDELANFYAKLGKRI